MLAIYGHAKIGWYGNANIDNKELIGFYGELDDFQAKYTEQAEDLFTVLIETLEEMTQEADAAADISQNRAITYWVLPKFSQFLELYLKQNTKVSINDLCHPKVEQVLPFAEPPVAEQYAPPFEISQDVGLSGEHTTVS